jgi:hypothetical protein
MFDIYPIVPSSLALRKRSYLYRKLTGAWKGTCISLHMYRSRSCTSARGISVVLAPLRTLLAADCCWLLAAGCSAGTTSPTNATARPENQGHYPSTSLPRAGSRYLDGVRVHVSAQLRDLRPLDMLDLFAILSKARAHAGSAGHTQSRRRCAGWVGVCGIASRAARRSSPRRRKPRQCCTCTPCKTGSVDTRCPGTRRARGSCRIELAQTSRPSQRRSCLPQAGRRWAG